MGTQDETARQVAIQHKVIEATEALAGRYHLLSDEERVARLEDRVFIVSALQPPLRRQELKKALISLSADAQAWLEALEVEAAR